MIQKTNTLKPSVSQAFKNLEIHSDSSVSEIKRGQSAKLEDDIPLDIENFIVDEKFALYKLNPPKPYSGNVNPREHVIDHPIINRMGNILRKNGIFDSDIRAAILVFLSLLSARLGVPFSLLLTDVYCMTGVKIIDFCLEFLPSNFFVVLKELSNDLLDKDVRNWRKKALVCFNEKNLTKGIDDLILVIERNLMSAYRLNHEICRQGFYHYPIEGPISLVTLSKEKKSLLHDNPMVLNVSLKNTKNLLLKKIMFSSINNPKNAHFRFTIDSESCRNVIGDLVPRFVYIPFIKQIINAINIIDISNKTNFEIFIRILKVITILNDCDPNGPIIEIHFDDSSYEKYLTEIRDPANYLTATKADYYLFWLLLKDYFIKENNNLNIKEKEITSLPHPSEIIDPIFNGMEIKVENPLTGEEEII